MPSFLGSTLDQFDQLPSSDDIDTSRDHVGARNHRFFLELLDAAVLIHLQDTEPAGICFLGIRAYHSNIRTFCNMIFQYLIEIQFVYAISRCDDYVRFMAVFQPAQVLTDRVCRSTVPPPCFLPKSHHLEELKCSFKDLALYCVRTATF